MEPIAPLVALVAVILLLVVLVGYYRLLSEVAVRAEQRYMEWRERDLARELASIDQVLRAQFAQQQQTWIDDNERAIRGDASRRSDYIGLGKAMQHFAPYLAAFSYDPRDARHFGDVVDLIVFDGLSTGRLKQIVFLEVKTGASARLNDKQREVRDAVREKRVAWEEFRVGEDKGS